MELPDNFAAEPLKEREFEVFDPGEYEFEVKESTLHTSKDSRKLSIKVQLECYHPQTFNKAIVFDYLTPNPDWKIRGFLRTINKAHLEAGGTVLNPYEFQGMAGRVFLKIETTEKYGKRNVVGRYIYKRDDIKIAGAPAAAPAAAPAPDTTPHPPGEEAPPFISEREEFIPSYDS